MRSLAIPLDRPDIAISLEKVVIDTYFVVRGNAIQVRNIIFTPLRYVSYVFIFVANIFIIVLSAFCLAILTILLSITLVIGNLIFFMQRDYVIDNYKHLDRKSLITLHLRTEKSLRTMTSMRHSRFLFDSPILGYLNRTFYENIKSFEGHLRTLAYPNIGNKPTDLPIHKLDPNDPWQDDLHLYSEEEIFTIP